LTESDLALRENAEVNREIAANPFKIPKVPPLPKTVSAPRETTSTSTNEVEQQQPSTSKAPRKPRRPPPAKPDTSELVRQLKATAPDVDIGKNYIRVNGQDLFDKNINVDTLLTSVVNKAGGQNPTKLRSGRSKKVMFYSENRFITFSPRPQIIYERTASTSSNMAAARAASSDSPADVNGRHTRLAAAYVRNARSIYIKNVVR